MSGTFYVCSYGVINCNKCRPLTVRGDLLALRRFGMCRVGEGGRYNLPVRDAELLVLLVATFGRDAITVTPEGEARDDDHRWSHDGTLDHVRSWAQPPAEDVMTDAAREREADDVRRALTLARHSHPHPTAPAEPGTSMLDEMLGTER